MTNIIELGTASEETKGGNQGTCDPGGEPCQLGAPLN